MTFIEFCVNRAMHDRLINAQAAVSDACLMVVERIEATISEIRTKSDDAEWRSACSAILTRIQKDMKGEG